MRGVALFFMCERDWPVHEAPRQLRPGFGMALRARVGSGQPIAQLIGGDDEIRARRDAGRVSWHWPDRHATRQLERTAHHG